MFLFYMLALFSFRNFVWRLNVLSGILFPSFVNGGQAGRADLVQDLVQSKYGLCIFSRLGAMSIDDRDIRDMHDNDLNRRFEACGLIIVNRESNNVIVGVNNPHYWDNKKRKLHIKVPMSNISSSEKVTTDEDALGVALRSWDDAVFYVLGDTVNLNRIRANKHLRELATNNPKNTKYVDKKGSNGIIRLYIIEYLESVESAIAVAVRDKIPTIRKSLLIFSGYMRYCDSLLGLYTNEATAIATTLSIHQLSGIAKISVEEIVNRICGISMFTVEFEKVLSGGRLLEAISAVTDRNAVEYEHWGETTKTVLGDIDFLLLREAFNKIGYNV